MKPNFMVILNYVNPLLNNWALVSKTGTIKHISLHILNKVLTGTHWEL